jgi:hypothetical protein
VSKVSSEVGNATIEATRAVRSALENRCRHSGECKWPASSRDTMRLASRGRHDAIEANALRQT